MRCVARVINRSFRRTLRLISTCRHRSILHAEWSKQFTLSLAILLAIFQPKILKGTSSYKKLASSAHWTLFLVASKQKLIDCSEASGSVAPPLPSEPQSTTFDSSETPTLKACPRKLQWAVENPNQRILITTLWSPEKISKK